MTAGSLFALMVAGLRSPRPVAAQVMARRPGLPGALLMMVLAYLIEAIVSAAIPGARGPGSGVSAAGLHVQSFALHAAMFGLLAGVGTWFGRLVGGTADFERVAVAVGWGFLVQSLLAPFVATAMAMSSPDGFPAAALFLMIVALGIWFWLMASCIAEAHGFASTFAVAAVIFGLSIPVGLIFGMLLLAGGA